MKTPFLIIFAVILMTFSACGQSGKDVPADVATAFSQKFPNASNVKWGKESDKEWEAEFKLDGKEYSANFDNSGIWAETEYEININEIPAAVKAALDKDSAGSRIEESAVTETKDGKAYEFIIIKNKNETELAIDMNGGIIKKDQIKEEGEYEEDEK
jgi:hypothetical protein